MLGPFNAVNQTPVLDAALYTVGASAAALAAASGVLPAVRTLFFGEPPETRYADRLPFYAIAEDGTLIDRQDRKSRVYRLNGKDSAVESDEARAATEALLADWIVSLRGGQIECRIFGTSEKTDLPPAPIPPTELLRDAAMRQHQALAPYFLADYHIVLSSRSTGQAADDRLQDAETQLLERLEPYGAVRLTQDRGEAAGFFGRILSPVQRPRPWGADENFGHAVAIDNPEFDFENNVIIWRSAEGRTCYGAAWTIRQLGTRMTPTLMAQLLSANLPVTFVQAFRVLDEAESTIVLKRKRAYVKQTGSKGAKKVLDEVIENLETRKSPEAVCEYGLAVFAHADTIGVFAEIGAALTGLFGTVGFEVMREGAFLQRVYETQFPGCAISPKRLHLFASDVAKALTFQRSDPGFAGSQWLSRPLGYVKTAHGQLHALSMHVTGDDNRPNGHGAAFGVTSSGKTVFVSWLAYLAMQNTTLRVFWFDTYRASFVSTRALGSLSRYVTFHGTNRNAGLNPCQLPDTPENREHLRDLLRLIIDPDNRGIAAITEHQINRCVSINFHRATPNHLRNLRHLLGVSFPAPVEGMSREETAGFTALKTWLDNPVQSACITAETDSLALDSRWMAFDYEKLVEAPLAAALVTQHVMHRILTQVRVQQHPTLVVIDEAKEHTRIPRMRVWIQRMYDQLRRLDGAIWTMWQYPRQVEEAGMLSTVIQGAGTKIIVPSENNIRTEYEKLLELPPAVLDVVTKVSPLVRGVTRPILIMRNARPTVISGDLSALGPQLLRIFSGTGGSEVLERLEAESGDPEKAFAEFLQLSSIQKAGR